MLHCRVLSHPSEGPVFRGKGMKKVNPEGGIGESVGAEAYPTQAINSPVRRRLHPVSRPYAGISFGNRLISCVKDESVICGTVCALMGALRIDRRW